MSQKVDVTDDPLIIRYKGVYDFEGIYRFMRQFLEEKRFDVEEGRYKDKETGPFGNEVEHKWECSREITPFVKYNLEIRTDFEGVKEFEANTDNGTKKVTSGKFEISLDGNVEFDWQNQYDSGWAKTFRDFYINTLFWNYYKYNYIAPFENYIYEFQRKIKDYADMEA